MTEGINISPKILRWAIERAGHNYNDYIVEHDDVKKWIAGDKKPTFKQLEKISSTLHVPIGYLFLNEPPEEHLPITLFRRANNGININILDTVDTLKERQEWLSGYLKEIDNKKIPFISQYSLANNTHEVSLRIRQLLKLPIDWALNTATTDKALNKLTTAIEQCGVIVVFNSIVGTNSHRPISVDDCRGFALVDSYAPFIFVNSKDAKSAQIFTLIHEFAHLLVGYSAGVGNIDITKTNATEQFCDSIAADFLMPKTFFDILWIAAPNDFDTLAKRSKLSRYVMLRCAKDYGHIDEQTYWQLYNKWQSEPVIAAKKGLGGDFYINVIRRTSRTFLLYVNSALGNNAILHTEAYRLTGLKGDTYRKVFNSQYIYG